MAKAKAKTKTKRKVKKRRKISDEARPSGGGRALASAGTGPKTLADDPYVVEDGVTQSLLGGWTHCRRQARWSLDGWRRRESKEALIFGSIFHKLLEIMYRGVLDGKFGPDDATRVFDDVTSNWIRNARKRLASPEEVSISEFCIAKARPVFEAYCVRYASTDFDPELWVELEGTFDVEWQGFRLRGMRDGLQQIGKRRALRLLETKTKSRIGQDLTRTLSFNFQNLYYLTGLNATLEARGEKRRARKVLYNIIRRPGLKLGKTESLPEHSERIAKHIEDAHRDPKKGPNYYFVRYEIDYPPEDQKVFAEELKLKLNDFKAWLRGDLPTYRNESACTGNWNCGYIPLCGGEEPDVQFDKSGVLFEELYE